MSKSSEASDAMRRYIMNQYYEYGYNFCEISGETDCQLEAHHIIYRSEAPGHRNLHSSKNLILLSGSISKNKKHPWYHAKLDRRDHLIKERKLWKVFPELLNKENYE